MEPEDCRFQVQIRTGGEVAHRGAWLSWELAEQSMEQVARYERLRYLAHSLGVKASGPRNIRRAPFPLAGAVVAVVERHPTGRLETVAMEAIMREPGRRCARCEGDGHGCDMCSGTGAVLQREALGSEG